MAGAWCRLLRGVVLLTSLRFSAGLAENVSWTRTADSTCGSGESGCDVESFIQIRKASHSECAVEFFTTVAKQLKNPDMPSEEAIISAFQKGCDPRASQYSNDCVAVKAAHHKIYTQTLGKLNGEVRRGFVTMSFAEYAVVMLFQCMWHNRHNPADHLGGHPFDTCTEQDLCNMMTTRKGFEMQLPSSASPSLASTSGTPIWPGWPGTGRSYPMTRVSLLHKSDGTSDASETILKKSGLRLSVVNGGSKEAQLLLEPKYDQGFQISWGQIRDGMLPEESIGGPPLRLQSGIVAALPGEVLRNFTTANSSAKMPPDFGQPLTLVVIGDPCNGNYLGGGQCNFRDYYGTNLTLPTLLNAALPTSDVWFLTGDNFYDRYGVFSVSFFEQLDEAAQAVPLISTPGNHDYWFEGDPGLVVDDETWGFDQFANGQCQFYAMDTAATWAPKAPAEQLISPPGTSASKFSVPPAFLDLSAAPEDNAKPINFQHYSIAGNVGFIVFTCIGEDPHVFVAEACSFMKEKNPDLVLMFGHWNRPGSGCKDGWDVPHVSQWALDHLDCAAFKGTGQSPYGPAKMAATRLKFVVGHQHCNCMTNFKLTSEDSCLDDDADPNEVDGFIIGSHGMSWDLGSTPLCSARFGLPVFRTEDQTLTVAYAKLSLDTEATHCEWYDPFCHDEPGEVSRTDLLLAFLGFTPSSWAHGVAGPYGKGILTAKMEALLACLKEKGTSLCSKDADLFDQWYSHSLQ